MTVPYYADDAVTLYRGDCREVMATLDLSASVLLTDPPYFKVKGEAWDNQWRNADEFLGWLGSVMDSALPLLAPSATAWVFAGPALVSRVEREVIAPRLRVLNSVRWVKEEGWHRKADIPAQRRYLTPWEGIVLAEQFDDVYGAQAKALHRQVFAPLGRYIQTERERAGWTRSDLEVALGYVSRSDPTRGTALCYRWEEGSSLPTAETYERMRGVLNATGGEYLRREYEDLRREYEDLRRPFRLDRATGPVSDVWKFPTVKAYPGKHPCEKPLSMLQHMIETSSRPGDVVLDPFAGSGSTADAARLTGRRAVLIEQDGGYCERIAERLSQSGATA